MYDWTFYLEAHLFEIENFSEKGAKPEKDIPGLHMTGDGGHEMCVEFEWFEGKLERTGLDIEKLV